MDRPISNRLRITFLIHSIISVILGAAMWLIPGRSLALMGWVDEFVRLPGSELDIPGQTFVDPLISRLLGSALLALAFSSYLGWRAKRWEQVDLLVQQETVFCVLGVVAFFYVLARSVRPMPPIGWVVMILLAAFAIAWGAAWWSEGRAAGK
ncbi:MAG: hypothetical protein A2W35_15300 [Chloroflexi bacterium RBG_16_57_11]|nr:MAG: hypothetical protein A2W35_15300 [Chloroflexi bacterium RBG_16_57_11]